MRLENVLSVESIRRNPASAGSHSRGARASHIYNRVKMEEREILGKVRCRDTHNIYGKLCGAKLKVSVSTVGPNSYLPKPNQLTSMDYVE